jgi:hypothetical protein
MKVIRVSIVIQTIDLIDVVLLCRKKLTLDQFMKDLLPALAAHIVGEKQKKKVEPGDPDVVAELEKMKKKIGEVYHKWMSTEVG